LNVDLSSRCERRAGDEIVNDYETALWETVSALGDMDTTCVIVGGILAAGGAAIPAAWLARRGPLLDI
jgi:ADP-ribosylglycohydrolase